MAFSAEKSICVSKEKEEETDKGLGMSKILVVNESNSVNESKQ